MTTINCGNVHFHHAAGSITHIVIQSPQLEGPSPLLPKVVPADLVHREHVGDPAQRKSSRVRSRSPQRPSMPAELLVALPEEASELLSFIPSTPNAHPAESIRSRSPHRPSVAAEFLAVLPSETTKLSAAKSMTPGAHLAGTMCLSTPEMLKRARFG